MSGAIYPLLAFVSIFFTSILWGRLTAREDFKSDGRLPMIYLAGLVGALFGAKVVYLLSEGWMLWPIYSDDPALVWQAWFTGKTVTGALLGGYLFVELAKKWFSYPRATGDLFAVIAPLGLAVSRIGCWVQGCCLGVAQGAGWWTITDRHGVHRWPSVQVEGLFNLLLFAFALFCWRKRYFEGQLFHVYLMAYGVFRFAHEFIRATPTVMGPISGYQIAALCIFALGAIRYWQRAHGRIGDLDGAVAVADTA